MPLTNTVWPDTPVPDAVKNWLETLYTLIDSKDPSVPERVAAMYTEDAIVYGVAGKATGRDGMCWAGSFHNPSSSAAFRNQLLKILRNHPGKGKKLGSDGISKA